MINWLIGQHADQGVEVDSRIVQLVIWSTDQGVEVDPLVIGQHVWSTNQGVGVDQLVNWSTRRSRSRS